MNGNAAAGRSRARLMVLGDRFPSDMASGRYLRINSFCRQLLRSYRCYYVDFAGVNSDEEAAASGLAFADRRSLPDRVGLGRSVLRHLRLSNARFIERAWPDYYRRTLAELRRLAEEWAIDGVVCLSGLHGEFPIGLGLPRVLDWADCFTLTSRRALANRGRDMSWSDRQRFRFEALRQAGRERYLLRNFDVTMTISPPDRAELLRLSGVAGDRVVIVPNGVAEAAMAAGELGGPRERSVAFWGNLDFPPNWTAVEHFYSDVFLPYLAPAGVRWSIYGRGAGREIRRIAEHPLIDLVGYCPDLFARVRNAGAMVNPMIEGSGLKNKVLEAFAMRMPVVSTPRGVEALPVEHGRVCLLADDPQGFAKAVLEVLDVPGRADELASAARRFVAERYTWASVGDQLNALVRDALESHGRGSRMAAGGTLETAPMRRLKE